MGMVLLSPSTFDDWCCLLKSTSEYFRWSLKEGFLISLFLGTWIAICWPMNASPPLLNRAMDTFKRCPRTEKPFKGLMAFFASAKNLNLMKQNASVVDFLTFLEMKTSTPQPGG